MKSPGACQIVFNDFEKFAASVPATSIVATPLAPAPFSAELILLRLKELKLIVGHSTPLMFTGDLNTGSARIVLPLEQTEPFRLNGLVLRPGDVAVFGPGAGYDGACPTKANWASLVLPAATLDALLEVPPQSSLRRAGVHAVLRASQETWAEAASLVAAVSQVAVEDPQVFKVAEALRGLRADLLEVLRGLLATTHQTGAAKAHTTVPGRQLIVRGVEDKLRADPSRAQSTEDVCAAIGVTPSRLKLAIEVSFGVAPEHYLRLRRLAMARAALRMAGRHATVVEQVAAAHGFRDVDSFVQEYRKGFGEAPLPIAARRTE